MATSNTHQNQEKAQKQKNGTCICIFKPIYFHTACLCTKTNVPSINMMIKIKRHNFKAIKQIDSKWNPGFWFLAYLLREDKNRHYSLIKIPNMSGFITPATVFGVFFTFHLIYFRADHRDIAIELMPFSSLSLLSVVWPSKCQTSRIGGN